MVFQCSIILYHYLLYTEALPVKQMYVHIGISIALPSPCSHYYADGPEFMQNSKERLGCIGENVSINCNAVGRPPPDVFLYQNETLLKQSLRNLSHHFALDSEGKFGVYTCVSNNTFGTVNVTTAFKMKRKVLGSMS